MNGTKQQLIKIGDIHSDSVVRLMAEAFKSYHPLKYVLDRDGESYDDGLLRIHRFWLDLYFEHGWPVVGCEANGIIQGVALVSPTERTVTKAILDALVSRLEGEIGVKAVERLAKYDEESESLAPDVVCHYLGVLAVDPSCQRSGVGRKLLAHVDAMAAADPQSTGVCLNTEVEANVGYYQRHGYEVVAKKKIFDFTSWCMFKSC